jgi:hypothetical protein
VEIEATNQKGKGGETPTCLSPRNKESCHTIGTVLMQSIAEIGIQLAINTIKKKINELSPRIPQILSKGNISRSTNKMLHADTTVITQ